MLRLNFIFMLFMSLSASAQLTDKYTSDYATFYRAEGLFEKAKFSAAQEEYKAFMKDNKELNHPFYVKAKYYNALCALRLYHADAELLLLEFLKEYPESIYRQDVYFELGRYYFRKNKFEGTVKWFAQIDILDLEADAHPEFYFKLGYSHFRENDPKVARDAFFEIINKESQYQNPALYYYSHLAYAEKNYQVALEGFEKLEDDPTFKKTVPTYIAQILYLQGKYDELLTYAPPIMESEGPKNSIEMAHLIGDAFYRKGKYDEAVPFLEEYNNKSATTRDEDYQLGFAYYKSGQFKNAIRTFDKVAKMRDDLGQMALYHIGECYLKQDNFLYARNAFELAATLPYDKEIQEDALYNYAILSYKLDYNPFDEAVEALNLYLKRYPDSPRNQDIYQYLVNVYTTMKNYKSAMASIDRIEEIDFRMKNAYQMMAYNRGVELFDNAQYIESMASFKLARRYPIDPHLTALSHYRTAEAHYKLKDYDQSIKDYKKFLEVPSSYGLDEHNDAYYNIAYCHFKKLDYERAIQNFRTFTQDPNEDSHEKITDSYLRIGDAYFVGQKDNEAIEFYRKAMREEGGQIDYAKYQVGLIQGFQKNYKGKATTMLDIVNNHGKSTFVISALYEAGEAFRLSNQKGKAMQRYEQLIIDHPYHPKVVHAVFQIASLNFIAENFSMAEKGYLRLVNEFDNPTKKKEALARLKDVYTALNKPEKYIALIEAEGGMSNYEKDTLLYFNAFHLYEDSLYRKSISAYDGYLREFTNPIFFIEANYYKGTAHYKLGEKDQAHHHYLQVLGRPNGIYTEFAALISSQREYDAKNYNKATIFYEKLEQTSTYPENKLTAQIGLMRCDALQENFAKAKLYANKVLLDPLSLDNVITEAHYVLAKAEMEVANYSSAVEEFRKVAKRTRGMIGAESQFSVALIYHLQEEYKTSEDEIRRLMKEQAGYDYWVAKALILQAKNSMGLEDYVQAEYTLNSVLNGYVVQGDGIIEETNDAMLVLLALKNRSKDIQNNDGNIIEIGGGSD